MITLSGWGEFPIIEPVDHCPVPCFWRKGFWKVFREISKENTTYIISHIRFAPTSWFAFFLAKKRWIPYIHIEHGTGFLIHKNRVIASVAKLVDLTLGRYIIRNAHHVICVSEAGRRWVSENFWRKGKISVIYRGFKFPKIKRRVHSIPKIGFVGRLTGLKNVAWLIEAVAQIQEKKWILEIVGDGEEWIHLKQLTHKLWIDEHVNFLGAKSHDWIMKEFYPTVDIFVNPSLQEWLPTTVIEALGMGCQVIATDVGGTGEIYGVVLIEPYNTNAIRNSILDILKHPQEILYQNIQFSLKSMKKYYAQLFHK